jgi:hypothetical protein
MGRGTSEGEGNGGGVGQPGDSSNATDLHVFDRAGLGRARAILAETTRRSWLVQVVCSVYSRYPNNRALPPYLRRREHPRVVAGLCTDD